MLGRRHRGEVVFVDGREVAPLEATEGMFAGCPSASVWGGLAVAVPAELRGLHRAYELQGGQLPWADLVAPSVPLAEEYEISAYTAAHISSVSTVIEGDKELYKHIRAMLTHPDGTYKKGECADVVVETYHSLIFSTYILALLYFFSWR